MFDGERIEAKKNRSQSQKETLTETDKRGNQEQEGEKKRKETSAHRIQRLAARNIADRLEATATFIHLRGSCPRGVSVWDSPSDQTR